MKLKAEIGGEQRDVEIVRDGDVLTAVVDGRRYSLEVSEPEPNVWLLKNDGAITELSVFESAKGISTVRSGANTFDVRVIDPKRLRGSETGAGAGEGSSEVKTAMPGKVVRILVAVGDTVIHGDGVIVVEAMKMQNELKAPRDGTIKEIRFSEGENVNAGDVLIMLD